MRGYIYTNKLVRTLDVISTDCDRIVDADTALTMLTHILDYDTICELIHAANTDALSQDYLDECLSIDITLDGVYAVLDLLESVPDILTHKFTVVLLGEIPLLVIGSKRV